MVQPGDVILQGIGMLLDCWTDSLLLDLPCTARICSTLSCPMDTLWQALWGLDGCDAAQHFPDILVMPCTSTQVRGLPWTCLPHSARA